MKTAEPWLQAGKYAAALMSDLPRRNGWTLAERAGDRAPDRMRRLLSPAVWDAAAVMRVVRRFAVAGLDQAARRRTWCTAPRASWPSTCWPGCSPAASGLDLACGDEVYGSCAQLHQFLEEHGLAYVLRVPSNFCLTVARGVTLTCKQAAATVLAAGRG